METANRSSLFVDSDVRIPSAPPSPEIKCEPLDEDDLVPQGSLGMASTALAQSLVPRQGFAPATAASASAAVAGNPSKDLGQHRLGPEWNTTQPMNHPGTTAPLPRPSEFRPRPVAPEVFTHAVFRPHSIGLPESSVGFGAPVPNNARQQQRQEHNYRRQCWRQRLRQSRTPEPLIPDASKTARETQFYLGVLRQHDPHEVTPRAFVEIMIRAAMRDHETAAEIKRLGLQKTLGPKLQPQAQAASVSHIRPSNMQPNGLFYLQPPGLQRPHNLPCNMPPPSAPPTTSYSQATHQPSHQHSRQPSPQLHTMSHSQTTLQARIAPQIAPQPLPQSTPVSESPTIGTWAHEKPSSQQEERVSEKVQDAIDDHAGAEEDDSSSDKDACWLTRYAGEYGKLSVREIIELAAAQQNSPTQHQDSDPKPLVEKSSPLQQPRSPGPSSELSSNSPVAPVASLNVQETKPSSIAPRNPSPRLVEPNPQPVRPSPQPAGFSSQSTRYSPARAPEDHRDPPSMLKDEPINFTCMLDQVEAELGWTGKYDKPNYTETRLRSLAVLAASQIERILKKLDGKMAKHASFANRVHILTVMREIVRAVIQTSTRSRVGDEAQRRLAHYQAQFLAAVDKLTGGQRNRLKIFEGGLWMREMQDTVDLAEGMGVSGDLELAIIRIDC
ncbi:hypothetical protein PG985_007081 [Apiospora marii]|uniref:uncharacterized protein n=1 Tax=Apiospora marii TaxID=335849 RepID=UPI00312EE8B0